MRWAKCYSALLHRENETRGTRRKIVEEHTGQRDADRMILLKGRDVKIDTRKSSVTILNDASDKGKCGKVRLHQH